MSKFIKVEYDSFDDIKEAHINTNSIILVERRNSNKADIIVNYGNGPIRLNTTADYDALIKKITT